MSDFLTFILHFVKAFCGAHLLGGGRMTLPVAGLEWDTWGYKELTTIPFL